MITLGYNIHFLMIDEMSHSKLVNITEKSLIFRVESTVDKSGYRIPKEDNFIG